MMKSIAVTGVIAAAVLAGPHADASTKVQTHTHREQVCVQTAEFNSINLADHLTLGQVAKAWGVVGSGFTAVVPGVGVEVTAFPRCGYGTAQAWYGVAVRPSGIVYGLASWYAGDTPTAPPCTARCA